MSIRKILSTVIFVSLVALLLTVTSGILCLIFTAVGLETIGSLLTGLLIFFATTWGLLIIAIVYLLACLQAGCCTTDADSCDTKKGGGTCQSGANEIGESVSSNADPF